MQYSFAREHHGIGEHKVLWQKFQHHILNEFRLKVVQWTVVQTKCIRIQLQHQKLQSNLQMHYFTLKSNRFSISEMFTLETFPSTTLK